MLTKHVAMGDTGGKCENNADFDQTIRNSLYTMSDHLPVILELQTTEELGVNDAVYNNGIKIVGSNVVSERLQLRITNSDVYNLTIYNTMCQIVFIGEITLFFLL